MRMTSEQDIFARKTLKKYKEMNSYGLLNILPTIQLENTYAGLIEFEIIRGGVAITKGIGTSAPEYNHFRQNNPLLYEIMCDPIILKVLVGSPLTNSGSKEFNFQRLHRLLSNHDCIRIINQKLGVIHAPKSSASSSAAQKKLPTSPPKLQQKRAATAQGQRGGSAAGDKFKRCRQEGNSIFTEKGLIDIKGFLKQQPEASTGKKRPCHTDSRPETPTPVNRTGYYIGCPALYERGRHY